MRWTVAPGWNSPVNELQISPHATAFASNIYFGLLSGPFAIAPGIDEERNTSVTRPRFKVERGPCTATNAVP